jgi:serine-type D-Ala-D-Ala carboxypeptidase/endopeptidase (penicillin-binding protein 4)
MDRQPGSNVLVIWGAVPLDDSGSSYAVAVDDPAKFAAGAFRRLLEQRGIKILGKERAAHALTANFPLQAPASSVVVGGKGGADNAPATESPRTILALHESLPLVEDLRVINKISQNLHAELVLRTLGRERGPLPTLDGSLATVSNVLTAAGVESNEYDLNDGSGMSLQNLITPRALVKVLRHADDAPWAALYRSTLPIAGVDGTISDRLRGTFAAGRIQAKTGTLGHVNTLSGYAQTIKGERLAFAIMSNNHKLTSSGAKHVIDNIALLMVDDAPRPPAPVLKKRKAGRRPAAVRPAPVNPPSPTVPE